jgi:hypothetical protein
MIQTPYGIRSEFNYRPGKPVRDEERLKFCRTFPCSVCKRAYQIEAAHTGPHGIGQKSGDDTTIPLCGRHHRTDPFSLHKLGPLKFQEKHVIDIPSLVLQLNELYRERKKKTA